MIKMSEFYRNKDYKRKTDYTGKEYKRSGPSGHRDKDITSKRGPIEKRQQPTILLKPREVDRASSPGTSSSSQKKDAETPASYQIQTKASSTEAANTGPEPMTSCVPLLNADFSSLQDLCLPYLSDQCDFLVVGCLGCQSVGKSTLLSLFADSSIDVTQSERFVFPSSATDVEGEGRSQTLGIDIFVTSHRIIILDCQPILSAMQHVPDSNGRTGEMQSLELAAFLFSVCHVVLFLQDYFLDPDLMRFLQTAEMLKPTMTPIDVTMIDHFPHLLFVHNKAESWEFRADRIKEIQETYLKLFTHSRLQINTGFGIANGDVSPMLNSSTCGELVNLFLLPKFDSDIEVYTGHHSFKDLFRQLRCQILSTQRTPLSHTPLTEKHWFHYANKVWDNIQKSTFFNEYQRLIYTL